MAVSTGIVGNAFMKKNLVVILWQHDSGNSFNADVALFMTTDALH